LKTAHFSQTWAVFAGFKASTVINIFIILLASKKIGVAKFYSNTNIVYI
jgi:hypothetical protein